jgi:deazaflavin-dependent oxidoreductase (nitroreductase family)
MSNESSARIAETRRDFKTEHLEMYLKSGGVEGHIVDLRDIRGHQFTTTLLLRTSGRKTHETRITPLIYGDIAGDVVVVASKGGADHHPAWYLNIKDSTEVGFQVATQAFRATWREPGPSERARIWDFMVGIFPPYRDYQASTAREIPLVMMAAQETVEPFKK